ncbi:retropepsin-like aspartic protease [Entomohabitans teleogrylli]|uniref:retropepsin-like aspartic protease n=1 Tax=Entomohabitans teleogrylli TaxID=1384589 RepID=UPI00073D6F5D|nr:retropepsin-like aspartic protease [Entomohabitans teleogrylli]
MHRGDYKQFIDEKRQRLQEEPQNSALRLDLARDELLSGNIEEARANLRLLLSDPQTESEATWQTGLIHYLYGEYATAEKYFSALKQAAPHYLKSKIGLLYVYYQTGQYARARYLFTDEQRASLSQSNDALVSLMHAYGEDKPYRTEWYAEKAVLPFISMNHLPIVSVRVNGYPINVFIDTGADLFVLKSDMATKLGLKPLASFTGTYAGGKTAEIGYSRLQALNLGDVTLHDVPVDIAEFPDSWVFTDETTGEKIEVNGILSTGVFRQFLTTLDYPQRQLILNKRQGERKSAAGITHSAATSIPFILDGTHFLIVRGEINGKAGMTFFLDSGLDDPQASILLQQGALDYAGIRLDRQQSYIPDNSKGGLGGGGFEITRLKIDSVALGPLKQRDLTGLYGVLPEVLYYTDSGILLDGFISHQFLKHYKWTLDFDAMMMMFE